MTVYYSTEEIKVAQVMAIRSVFTVGVDLGQTTDPTAIAIIEREVVPGCSVLHNRQQRDGSFREFWGPDPRKDKVTYILRHLERLKLGTSYVEQVAHVHSMLGRPPLSNTPKTALIIDQTGVGRAVFDMFRGVGAHPIGCTITAGENETETMDGYRVAKLQLVSRLQAMLHSGELEIAGDLPDLSALKGELQNFRVNFTQVGNMTFAARVGAHDDLVLAVAIALWYAEYRQQNSVSVRDL